MCHHPEGWVFRLDRGSLGRTALSGAMSGREGRRPAARSRPSPTSNATFLERLRPRSMETACNDCSHEAAKPCPPGGGIHARVVACEYTARRRTALVKQGGELPIERWINDRHFGDSGRATRRRSDAAGALPRSVGGPPRPGISGAVDPTKEGGRDEDGDRGRRFRGRRPRKRRSDRGLRALAAAMIAEACEPTARAERE